MENEQLLLDIQDSIDKIIILHIRMSIQQLKSKYSSAIVIKNSNHNSFEISIYNSFFNRFFYKLNNEKILLLLKEVNSINDHIFIYNKKNTFHFKYLKEDKAKLIKNIDNF